MPNAMERQQIIAERKYPTERKERLWVRDSRQDFEIYRVPVEGLVLNVDNRRFRAERMWAEEQLGRSLDPENFPDDERSIESLLLDTSHRVQDNQIVGTSSSDFQALRNDWLRRGQDTPIWTRPDGAVRNGNRRLAMVKRLKREGGDAGLQWIEAVILDVEHFDEPTLLEMEQREQLTENFKVRYNDIDYLLALREAAEHRDIDWFDRQSIDDVAGELQSMVEKSRNEVVRDLFAIKYMDQFLEDSNQAGQYHRLLRTLERFRDIGRMMMQVEEDYPLEADQILQVLFAAVRSGQTHGDIRSIRKMFRHDRPRFDVLASEVGAAEEQAQGNGDPTLVSPTATDPETDDDEEGENGGPEVANYPKTEVARTIKVAIDGYRAANEMDVLTTLQEVRNRLGALTDQDRLRQTLSTEDDTSRKVRDELSSIVVWAEENRSLTDL